jgi:hypothetical protein
MTKLSTAAVQAPIATSSTRAGAVPMPGPFVSANRTITLRVVLDDRAVVGEQVADEIDRILEVFDEMEHRDVPGRGTERSQPRGHLLLQLVDTVAEHPEVSGRLAS